MHLILGVVDGVSNFTKVTVKRVRVPTNLALGKPYTLVLLLDAISCLLNELNAFLGQVSVRSRFMFSETLVLTVPVSGVHDIFAQIFEHFLT